MTLIYTFNCLQVANWSQVTPTQKESTDALKQIKLDETKLRYENPSHDLNMKTRIYFMKTSAGDVEKIFFQRMA